MPKDLECFVLSPLKDPTLYPVVQFKIPMTIGTFIKLSPKNDTIPYKSNRKDYKKFFLKQVRWALDYYKDCEDEELLGLMGMPRMDEIFDWEEED